MISVVVATYKRPDFAEKCIRNLLADTCDNFEIIVVGQGDDEETRRMVERYFGGDSRVRYVHAPVAGLSGARNIGYRQARGEIIVFIDDDATVLPGLLGAYADVFVGETEFGMAGGRLLPEWDEPCPEWYPHERKFLLGLFDAGDEPGEFPPGSLPPGANFAVRKKVLDDLGGFDERVGFSAGRTNSMIAGEDSLLALRVKAAGYKIWYQPRATVHHFIAGYKLRKKYYLRRHFWEGVTVTRLAELMKLPSRFSMVADAVRKTVYIAVRFMKLLAALLKHRSADNSRVMLHLGILFYHCGEFYEMVRFACRGDA
ncbi:MAG: glycosyltransferase [Nitrospirae bacterium]|nr:glycosyltransferase [Nitrospirota bacterium]